MEGIFSTFGIDWRTLLIQAINFAVLMVGLWYFLYGPIMRMLEERRSKVMQGVKDAEAAHKELEEIESARSTMLAQAGKEADTVISNARRAAVEEERSILARAENGATNVLKDAEAQAKDMKNRAIEESREEVAKLIVLGMEKALLK
jgi:F-type H+-transporting ATPase subunit b